MSVNQCTLKEISKKLLCLSKIDVSDEAAKHINQQLEAFNLYLSFLEKQGYIQKRVTFTSTPSASPPLLLPPRRLDSLLSLKQCRSTVAIPAPDGCGSSRKKPEDFKTIVGSIRGEWNKVVKSNLDVQTAKILSLLDQVLDEQGQSKIGVMLFEMATHHELYAIEYAEIWHSLAKDHPFLTNVVTQNVVTFMDRFACFEKNIDPSKDYDEFCRITQLKKSLRALSKFLTHSAIFGSLPKHDVFDILHSLVTSLMSENSCLSSIQEEKVTIINILITEGMSILHTCPGWHQLIADLEDYVSRQTKATMSSRITFTMKDIFFMVQNRGLFERPASPVITTPPCNSSVDSQATSNGEVIIKEVVSADRDSNETVEASVDSWEILEEDDCM